MGAEAPKAKPRPSLEDATVLALLPSYLDNIEDFVALTSVSRSVRSGVHEAITPHQHLRLAYNSRRTFLRPGALFLLTHLIKGLSIWSSRSPANLRRFVQHTWLGAEGVLGLAVSVPEVARLAGWTIHKPQEMYEWRMRVMGPLVDLLDKSVGEQWRAQEDFWNREDAFTLDADPPGLLFRLIMYGEAFGGAYTGILCGRGGDEGAGKGKGADSSGAEGVTPIHLLPHLSLATRLEFIKYLFPDWRLPRHPSALWPITSKRDIRADEHAYIRVPAGETMRLFAGFPGYALQPDMKVFTHPLRDVRTDLGPYAGHWEPVLRFPVDGGGVGEQDGWVMSQRAEHEENVAAAEHMLTKSVYWNQFVLDLASAVDDCSWLSEPAESVSIEEQSPTRKAIRTAMEGDMSQTEGQTFRRLSKWTHITGSPWLFGLQGVELLAEFYRYRSRQETAERMARAPAADRIAESGASQSAPLWSASPVDIAKVAGDLSRVMLTMSEQSGDLLGPVEVGNGMCFEIPCLAAETFMLMRQ